MTSKSLSRRAVLQALGAGVLGGGLTSRRAKAGPATPLDPSKPGTLVWEVPLPTGYGVQNVPMFTGGSLLRILQPGDSNTSVFLWLDSQTRQYGPDPNKPWVIENSNGTALTPVSYNGVVYIVFLGQGIWAIDPNTRATLWFTADFSVSGNPAMVSGQLALPTHDGLIVAVDHLLRKRRRRRGRPTGSATSAGASRP